MKRLLAICLAAAFVLLTFGGCSFKMPSVTPAETTVAKKAENSDKASFDGATHDLSIALTCAMRTLSEPELINAPSVLWDTLGWYCGLNAMNGGADELTADEVNALQYTLRPEKTFLPIPTHYEESNKIYAKEVGNEKVYRFPDYVDTYKTLFADVYDFAVENYAADTVKVTVTPKTGGEGQIYLYSFQKSVNGSVSFPYTLSSMILPGSGTASDADITYEKLMAANTVTALLRKYRTVGAKSTFEDGSADERYYFTKEGVVASTHKYTEADGAKTYTGTYDGRYFFEEDGHLTAYQSLYNGEGTEYSYDYDIAAKFEVGTVFSVREKESCYSFYIKPAYAMGAEGDGAAVEQTEAPTEEITAESETASEQEKTTAEKATEKAEETLEWGTADVYYEVDKTTLALKKAVWNKGTDYEITTEFTYGVTVNDFQLTDNWDELRTVTFVCSMVDEKGEMYEDVFKYEVPVDMELIPTAMENLALYNNAANTEEYEYPGNGEDYIVYVTNVMG